MITWIKKEDREKYENLMHQLGSEPKIDQERGDYLMVEFSGEAIQIWVQVGYWQGWPPE